MLGQLGDGGDPAEVAATVFHRFCRSLHHDLKSGMLKSDEVAHRLYRVAWQTELQVPEDSAQFCNWVDDEFALVRQGIKERGPAEDALLEFLRKFDDTSTALM